MTSGEEKERLVIREVGPKGTHVRTLTNTVDMGAGNTAERQPDAKATAKE
ncbi:hypothetical protein GTO91_06800 [Heliobacterium undosum]|uniref:Uncharacterized protein n=1 Tax=Heliomicrobium undosum TaxID=121734 RepID=A0A845KZC5_9FIRM|nr:hypothetical protein [Heliomicrobium undosum]MZP29412.1 hypothetical protein [Heliomicrobium undosum]